MFGHGNIRVGSGICWGVLLVLVSLHTSAFGEYNLLSQKDGAAINDRLGWSVAGAGDVNHDGVPDYIVGAPYADPSGLSSAGSAMVYSGATGALLFQKNGTSIGEALGCYVSGAGDLNGDGRADFIVASQLRAYVYSGSNGSLLHQRTGGGPVADAGDVNGDGRDDFMVSNLDLTFVYSGANGALLYQKTGGSAIAGIGDVNGDGRSDFLVCDQYADNGGTNSGSAWIYSGATGSLLYQKNGASQYDLLGFSAAGVGDVNGDGRPDFILGARLADAGGLNSGAAYVYSGATGALLHQKSGNAGEEWGHSVGGAGDADGDGRADFLIGSIVASPGGLSGAGSVFLFSGATGALLARFDGTAAQDVFGWSISGVGDVDGNGRSDFIIGSPYADPSGRFGAGSAYIYGNGSGTGEDPCNPDVTAPTLICVGDKEIGCDEDVVFDQPTATDNCDPAPVIDVVSTTETPGPGPDQVTHTRTWTATDASGNVSAPCSQNIVYTCASDPCDTDVNPPTLTCVDDKQIGCGEDVVFDQPTATDNCDPSPVISIVSTTETPGPGPDKVTHTRTWEATDASGNVSDPCSQSIVYFCASDPCDTDVTPPTLTCADDKQIGCGEDVVFDLPTASDNCDPSPVITTVSTTETPGPGPNQVTHTRTWTATDASGNVSDPCSQSIVYTCDPGGGEFRSQLVNGSTGCASFVDGSAADLTQMCYTTRKDKIAKVSERIFFYYVMIVAPSSSFTVDIVQANDNAAIPLFDVYRRAAVTAYHNCTVVGSGDTYSPGQASVYMTGATAGQEYVIGVKYVTSSLAGTRASDPAPTAHYEFTTEIDGVPIDLGPEWLGLAKCGGKGRGVAGLPDDFELGNYPNPFNPTTTIEFYLDEAADYTLTIYNVTGRVVAEFEGYGQVGLNSEIWDAGGRASGVYFYRLASGGDISATKKMILVK